MRLTFLFALTTLFTATGTFADNITYELVERATVNGQCTGDGGAPGVCIATAKCTAAGGKYVSNKCPGTPDDIKCCTKTSCSTNGNCRWTSQCSGSTLTGLCPGPDNFKCCIPSSSSTSTTTSSSSNNDVSYPKPTFPAVGKCKKRSVDGAKKIVAGLPGRVRQIYCTRNCSCPGDSDHCCGLAVDLMCSKAGGVKTTSGKVIAEWVMLHRKSLNLKYVIWGQKIWNPSRDSVKPWSKWRPMEDRGSITQNHWDHVHVSFND
ncbi:hypothetical protein CPB86DRAFT_775369 [Serendipita vermifera]|nr:hypothetical protein CPB86DRAFT_775369 [Serendipita vermifera]